jgi:restriction system protein
MNPSSLAETAPRPAARPSPHPAGASRRQRTFTVVDLIRDATLSLVQRFVGPREPAGRELAGAAEAASAELHGEGAPTEKARLMAARRHLTDLLAIYEHFLVQRRLRQWNKDDAEARAVRTVGQRASIGQVGYRSPAGPQTYADWLEQSDPGVVANTILCLIHQANYMLDRQIKLMLQGFRPDPGAVPAPGRPVLEPEPPEEPVPSCPLCHLPMISRLAKRGTKAGAPFWGCSAYPRCKGVRDGEKKAADSRPRPAG